MEGKILWVAVCYLFEGWT